jgi:hypothetical protein
MNIQHKLFKLCKNFFAYFQDFFLSRVAKIASIFDFRIKKLIPVISMAGYSRALRLVTSI